MVPILLLKFAGHSAHRLPVLAALAAASVLGLALPGQAAPRNTPASAKASTSADAAASKKPVPAKKSGPLDTATVRKYYLDGDFDPAIDLVETTLRYKTGFSHEDSVFMFKHLGVMYAARYETREKGKHYMHRLLEVEPTARILDMYASDMIYMIFKNIQDEFDSTRQRLGRTNSAGGGQGNGPQDSPRPSPETEKKEGSSAFLWLGGATVAVAAGVATYFYFSDEPKVTTVDHQP